MRFIVNIPRRAGLWQRQWFKICRTRKMAGKGKPSRLSIRSSAGLVRQMGRKVNPQPGSRRRFNVQR
ncbi:hypothetical protein NS365_09525 [Aureimonas ureilytica]|uniref:Uncharacterized protein n=1 Tax=Aureimonas ureilytica TaxID=401562 RepID=A0A175RQK2_9HYPH|nr:hypothetical protein NS226_19490 [Aureimonas ureilytica]KTR06010.1 hypothetical protein NS365_09525 [Aureimonas ureilytica]